MSKSLEWLDYYKQKITESNQTFRPDGFSLIEKELKAFEIIKNKRVNVLELSTCANYETYMSFFKQWNWNGEYDDFILTQEEYDVVRTALLYKEDFE